MKSTIISEIEENLASLPSSLTSLSSSSSSSSSNVASKAKLFDDDIITSYIDRDMLTTSKALEIASIHGIDTQFSMIYEEQLKKQNRKQTNTASYSTTEDILEEQFDAFLSRLELLESEEYSSVAEDDDVDALARERVLNIKLPNSAFEPLLAHLTPSRALLHQALLQQSLISGQHQKGKKKTKSDRKDKKRRDKERDREKESRSQDYGKVKSRKDKQFQNIEFYSSSQQINSNPIQLAATSAREKYQDVIGAIVAKSIADASVSSYLITVALLLRIMKQDNNITTSDSSEILSGPVNSLPVGNLIASLFEKIEVHEFRNDQNLPTHDVAVQNPFRKLLLKSTLTKGETVSVSFSADGGSEFGESRSVVEGETASQSGYFPGAYSDAGSTVGSNLAEQGTETASVCDDDISEEELLAQALALSMSSSKNTGVPDRSTSEVGSAIVSETASIHESVLNDLNLRQSLMDIPEYLPSLPSLSTWGPFCDRYFWQTIMNIHTTEHVDLLPSLSLKQVVFALIIVVAANADNVLAESMNSNVALDSFSKESSGLNADESKLNETSSKHFLGSSQSTPHALPFLIIEMLLDFLMKELVAHSKESQDSENQEFNHHRYFLIWSITMLLKVLRAELNSAVTSGASPWTIGLGVADNVESSTTNERPFVFYRLLEQIADCMGLDSSIGGRYDGLINSAIGSSSKLKLDRHTLRMFAIDTFVAGITIFKPTYDERIRLLKNLLQEAPCCDDADIANLTCSQFSCYDMNVGNSNIRVYYLYLLQKLCLGDVYATFNLKSRCKEVSGGSSEDSDNSQPDSPSEGVLNAISASCNSDEAISPVGETDSTNNLSIEMLLLNRLSRHDIMLNARNGTNLVKPLFWGELILYKAIIGHHLNNYINVYNTFSPSAQNLIFNSQRCDQQIVLSDNNKTATYKATKTWATVCAGGRGLAPSSGTHKWTIKIDKCDRGHVFVGIVTAEASLSTYAGGDRYGWGLIGTRTLWHNKSKVKSDVGPGFGTQSLVYLSLNTDIGEFSFKTDNCDWTVIFKDLPNVPLFPAISVHHREDRVSISPFMAFKSQSYDDSSSILSFDKSMRLQAPFIRSMQLLCSRTFQILKESDKYKDNLNHQLTILSHPFLGYILPSITAVIASSDAKCDLTGLSSIQLCPYLTIVTKKMADVCSNLQKQRIRRSSTNLSDSMINVEGDWIFQSATASNIPAQEYKISFEYLNETIRTKFETAQDDPVSTSAIQISGQGKSSVSAVTVDGTVSGTRLKFTETWTMGGTCVVEGRLSLCGCYFAGSFKDEKTGAIGLIEAFCMKPTTSVKHDVNYTSSILLKSSLLCAMATGKYVANLIIGLNPINKIAIINENANIESGPSADDQTVNEDMDEVNDVNIMEKWATSDLFSGGLPLEQELLAYLTDEIKVFLTFGGHSADIGNILSIAEISDSDHDLPSLLQWWLTCVFPLLSTTKNKKLSNKSYEIEEDPISKEELDTDGDLIQDIILNQNCGKRIDEYVLHHTGQSALSKIGGQIMQNTRRLILAALIKHSGCKCLCNTENEALRKGSKSIFDRPHTILLDVWRASQKCIEHAVRHKQKSGLPYQVICKSLSIKAELLLSIEPNVACTAVMASLEKFCQELMSFDIVQGVAETDVQQDCSKLLASSVEFLSSPLRDAEVDKLHVLLKQNSLKGVSRNAGLRAFLLLVNKLDIPFGDAVFQPHCPLILHSTLVRYVSAAFYGQTDIDSDGAFQSSDVSSGHYSGDLKGLCTSLLSHLKTSFESVYEFIAQLVSRCTWSGDRDGQCIALSAWGLKILPDDHIFINRVGIFRILHTVLDDVRTSMAQEESSVSSQGGPFAKEMKSKSNKRLAQMVLKVVHSLASQVAFSDDNNVIISPTSALKLQKRPSGPDTLSHSLFDMLYAELYVGSRSLILNADTPIGNMAIGVQDDNLYGEQYVYRILRLLYFVSNSTACRTSLSSPKWITLFMFVVSCGGTVLQRKVLRLIRRLLINVEPSNFRAYIPSIFANDDIIDSDVPLDDDDVNLLIDQQLIQKSSLFGEMTCSERFITFFLEGISIVIPADSSQKEETSSLPAESLLILRVLQGVPTWRTVINKVVQNFLLQNFSVLNSEVWNNASYLRIAVACLAIFGGHIDRLRVGGIVSIRPNVVMTDSLANRLVAISRSSGLLVEIADESVEVIFMERGVNTNIVHMNPFEMNSIQYTAVMPTTQNVIVGKINKKDIFPASDVPVIANFASRSVFENTLNLLSIYGIPWLIQEFHRENLKGGINDLESSKDQTDSKDKVHHEDEISDIYAVQLYTHTSAFREVSTILECNDHIASLLSSTDVFKNLILLASEKCDSGSLAVVELIEERWTRLWDIYTSNDSIDESNNDDDKRGKTPEFVEQSNQEEVATRQINQDLTARSMLLEAAAISGIFASFGEPRQIDPAAQAAAIAQMVDIGLPREWSEVALRRCRYNVEMAINMCFEHGADMSQIVAEDQMMQAASQRAEANRRSGRSNDPSGRSAPSRRRGGGSAESSLMRQLLDMGFPPSWCTRAMDATNNNVDAALSWILSHGEELVIDPDQQETPTPVVEIASSKSIQAKNPLCTISGSSIIKEDLTCTSQDAGFPSVGCRGFGVSTGKWYYELHLNTAGCVQVGWVDSAYEGNADNGEGVGDDEHSWAFDGWRMYLWHKTSVEWGSRWDKGDTVGCAVDFDEGTMSFFLNGYGEEIDMGTAFRNIPYNSLYPCVSFNKRESVQFNFGSTPFRTSLPPGYRPFIEHISAVQESNIKIKEEFYDKKYFPSLHIFTSHTGNRDSEEGEPSATVEDALDECKRDSYFHCTRRYFQPDDSRLNNEANVSFPNTNLSSTLPKDRQSVLKQFHHISRDLCVLYARMAVLRILNGFPMLSSENKSVFVNICMEKVDESESFALGALLKIIRLCGASSTRTKIYLNVMSLLSSTSSAPNNLGSIFSTGGAPMLADLQGAITCLVNEFGLRNNSKLIENFLDNIFIDLLNSTRRDISQQWIMDNNFCPVIFSDYVSDSTMLKQPSLILATSYTNILLRLFANEDSSRPIETTAWIIKLLKFWNYGIRSPSMLVKLCSIRMITMIVEEVSQGYHFLNSREKVVPIILEMLPRWRIENHALNRLNQERGSLPLCSTYLQALLEQVSVLRQAEITITNASTANEKTALDTDNLENYIDVNDPSFNWEIVSGRLLSDDGIETWSGTIKQNSPEMELRPDDRKSLERERQELPPELMPGCKVCRIIRKLSEREKVIHLSDDESEEAVPPLTEEDESSAEIETITEQIGSVLEICSWDDSSSSKGDARIIKWDDNDIPEKIRWGAEGKFEATHVKVKDGKITVKYQDPMSKDTKLLNSSFGIDCCFGAILRILKLPPRENETSLLGRFVGIMELPDFGASIFIVGIISHYGWTFKEKSLISGASHSSWSVRFGHSHWRSGTEYKVITTSSSNTDNNNAKMCGTYAYEATLYDKTITITGTLSFQQSRLFIFDDRYNPVGTGLIISGDKLSVGKDLRTSRSSSHCCVYGNIGFSSGVHYWEFKIDQADSAGSIFLGVSEKQPPFSKSPPKADRWYGYGFVNNRASIRPGHSSISDRYNVYGDLFQTGDIVGVMLDMNRGRLSFFLDGTKFGEHTIADLGEAFDNLNSTNSIPKVFYPVVGLSKSQDRVAITPRWISSGGIRASDEVANVSKAYSLLYEWNMERPTPSMPNSSTMWIYRYAWCDWCRWTSSRFIRIRTRCKAMSICVDVSPKACIDASIRLGLSVAIFRGDRLRFSKSSGRILEAKEEAIVLGAYNGRLWYRLDTQTQQGDGNIMESASLAWCLIQNDVEGMELMRRGIIDKILPSEIIEMPLPRIPSFQGGMIFLSHSGEAFLRNGLEIDTSEVLCKIPPNTSLYAIEKRVNASNITRYRVMYENKFGWISERMRGGTEDLMLSKVSNVTEEQIKEAIASITSAAKEQNFTDRIVFEDVSSMSEALEYWESCIKKSGFEKLLNPSGPLGLNAHQSNNKFEDFIQLSTTMDGVKVWSVEDDMQLAEVISRVAEREGVSSQNLSCSSVETFLRSIDAPSSSLYQIDPQRALARASILRVANQILGFALPYLSLQLPEDKLRRDCRGTDDDIEILTSIIPKGTEVSDPSSPSSFSLKPKALTLMCCGSRRLRSLRRLLFNQTKISFWESILESTTTPTQLPQDEYEDPREIKVVKINRIKATLNRLASISNPMERLKLSVCGQLHKEMKSWQNSSFRRSYLGKGHGGQRRGFKVKFLGEGVDDYGGPYRAVFEQIVDELQCDSLLVGKNASDRCLLPLFIPCPNRLSSIGANQDKYILSTAPASPFTQEMMYFFGKLMGTAVRHNLHLGLDLSSLLWRPLVRLAVSRAHLETVDTLTSTQLQGVIRVGLSFEQKAMNEGIEIDKNFKPEEWADLNFSIFLPDGTRFPLVQGGEDIPVNLGNWRYYVELAERHRLKANADVFKVLREGLACVLPIELLPLFTASELEQLVSGTRVVDVNMLRQCTEYENISPDSDTVKNFWSVLEEMTDEERTLFLRFVWARSRMPTSAQDSSMNFKLLGAQGAAKDDPDRYLPHAQTCFFSLSLPPYSTKEIMRNKLIYAINNSPNMDADVRLHNADGWAES